MQFSIVAMLALVAATVSAGPAPLFLKNRDDCDIKDCILDLGPSVVGCASAVAQLGADPFSDVGCLLSAVKEVANFPPSCAGCLAKFGVDPNAITSATAPVTSVVDSAEGALGDAADKVEGFFSGLF
ncbi:hypothetical protein C8F01DRAFT_1184891 [Mycena amicta]|nr:hypothetical protein C8F01DRAFT_1184891 [Mycena amicta]